MKTTKKEIKNLIKRKVITENKDPQFFYKVGRVHGEDDLKNGNWGNIVDSIQQLIPNEFMTRDDIVYFAKGYVDAMQEKISNEMQQVNDYANDMFVNRANKKKE
jgi:hypothetical protein